MVEDAAQLRHQRERLANAVKDLLRRKVALSPDLAPPVPAATNPADARRRITSSLGEPLPTLTDEELESEVELLDPGELPAVDGYDVIGEVGRGGQGVVYRATERATGGDVAVKVLPGGHFADGRARSRFAREIRILARVAGPSVVPILDHGRTGDGSSFLVMPYIDGLPLGGFAATLRGNDRAIATLFARVADALDAVHRAGVTHRDLKPDNIRVDRDAVPHLLDFGYADSPLDKTRLLTRSGQVIGTLAWLSPEQAEGRRRVVGPRSDVYSLGLILCRAVATGGAPAYAVDGTYDEVMTSIRDAVPQVAGRSRGDPMARVVLKCLAKRPAGRYASSATLASALRRVAGQ